MNRVFNNTSRALLTSLMAALLVIPSVSVAKNLVEEPSAGEMVLDAVVARPVLLVATVLGTALYVVTLPFSLAGGNAEEAGNALVVGPARSTFARCLGCRVSGHQK
jgi:ABC-type molybdate transport system permease subunit